MVLRSAFVKTVLVASVASLGACAVAPGELEESTSAALSTCGNGVREADEQCDDGDGNSLDGCSSTCKFEQMQRINGLDIQFGTDAFCTANALGGAVGSMAQGQIGDALKGAIADGSASVLFSFGNLADLTGTNATNVVLGSFVGQPVPGAGYDGTRDLDWWYTPTAASLGPDGAPLVSLNANIVNKALTAGPGNMAFALALGAGNANISLSNVRAKATVGAASTPGAATATTGHAASENLDPAITTFASLTGGQLCGNVSAASLAAVPVPPQLQAGGTPGCSEGYTATHTMLDVFTSGCKVFFFSALGATQPDQANPTAPVAGAGAPYKLVTANKRVTGCKDKSGATVDLNACLAAAAYSTSFKFSTGRVVAQSN